MDNIKQLIGLPENAVIEYKSAKGGLPASLWETYSSFANSNGGIIVLGVKEKNGHLTSDNLTEDQLIAYKKNFCDIVHNREKVSATLVTENDVTIENWQGSSILVINVPRARFDQRPVFLNHNPFGNTYVRHNEGDYLCSDEDVRIMFADAESQDHSFDRKILKNYTLDDLDMPTILAYRNRFKWRNEVHPWILQKKQEQLTRQNGGQNGVEHDVVKLTDRQHIIMSLIRQFVVEHVVDGVVEDGVEKLSARVIAQKVKSSTRTIQRELSYLQEKGLIKYKGTDTKGYYEIIE